MAQTLEIKLYTPHAKQKQVMRHYGCTARFRVLNWGRRTGKSTFAINEALYSALQVKGRYWVVCPTYAMAKNIFWRQLAVTEIPPELILKKNESELIVTLVNGSTIELKGSDKEDSLRGAGIKGLVMDEYAFQKSTAWDMVLRPMLVDSSGWAIFISTPNGFNSFFGLSERAKEADGWAYSHATTYDNPHIPSSEVDAIKTDLIAKEREDGEIRFKQEYLAEFKKKTGLVYKAFDREKHIVDPKAVPKEGTHMLGIDFGYANPLAAMFVLVDYDNNWWVYDELYRTQMKTSQYATILKQKMAGNSFSYIIGDSAAAQEIANLREHQLNVLPVVKATGGSAEGSIASGIRLVQDKLAIQEGTGKPKLFISRTCSNIINEFESYSYPEKKEGHNDAELPIDEFNHALDALRYLAITVNRAVDPVDDPPSTPDVSTFIY